MANQNSAGTFSGTGQSATVTGKQVQFKLSFAGTASVDIEFLLGSSTWVKDPDGTAITASCIKVWDSPVSNQLRLNCTAHTNNVVYDIQAAD